MDIEILKELIQSENNNLWDYKEELLELVEKATPKKPHMDMWFACPFCGYEDDDFDDLLGFEPDPQPGHPDKVKWVGPSFCRKCGQSLDVSELNGED